MGNVGACLRRSNILCCYRCARSVICIWKHQTTNVYCSGSQTFQQWAHPKKKRRFIIAAAQAFVAIVVIGQQFLSPPRPQAAGCLSLDTHTWVCLVGFVTHPRTGWSCFGCNQMLHNVPWINMCAHTQSLSFPICREVGNPLKLDALTTPRSRNGGKDLKIWWEGVTFRETGQEETRSVILSTAPCFRERKIVDGTWWVGP